MEMEMDLNFDRSMFDGYVDQMFKILNGCIDTSSPSTIKEEEVPNEELFYCNDVQFQQQDPNGSYELVESFGNTVSIPETSQYTVPFTEEQVNQILATADDNMPMDFGNMICKMGNGIKNEQMAATSHYVKYKNDENGKNVKIWECGICHKEFGHQYILMRHLPTHTDERKFQCKQCGKAFRQMSTLSQHRAIHSKLRPYICEVCQKTFNRVSTLISHRKTHTGHKPHRCHLCNKAFHQKGNLRNHIFTHTNERPYKCDICQKGFNQMSNLMCHKFKAHQRADKPKYNCQTCGKEFDKRIGLRNHEQYEHGDTTSNSTVVNIPSVKYTNGVLVAPINTAAMRHAITTNQVPFALLRPLSGIPVLVRVLPAGDKQMLVPATAEDLKKFGEITIKKKEGEDGEKKDGENKENVDNNDVAILENTTVLNGVTNDDKEGGATVQIRIPVVASVVQRCLDGNMVMDVESPGPRTDGQDDYHLFTTTDEEFNKPVADKPIQDGDILGEKNISNQLPENTQVTIYDPYITSDDEKKMNFAELVYNMPVLMEANIADYNLNQMHVFDSNTMVMDMDPPLLSLGENNIALDNILNSNDLFTSNSTQIFEQIINSDVSTLDPNNIGLYEPSHEDFDIRVD